MPHALEVHRGLLPFRAVYRFAALDELTFHYLRYEPEVTMTWAPPRYFRLLAMVLSGVARVRLERRELTDRFGARRERRDVVDLAPPRVAAPDVAGPPLAELLAEPRLLALLLRRDALLQIAQNLLQGRPRRKAHRQLREEALQIGDPPSSPVDTL